MVEDEREGQYQLRIWDRSLIWKEIAKRKEGCWLTLVVLVENEREEKN
jgi:hypothetical protein